MTIQQSSIVLNGSTLRFLHAGHCVGDKNKPVMVLLHGFPENSWTWEHYLRAYSEKYQVYAPDLPGYNFSDGLGDDENYTIENLMGCLTEFINSIRNGHKVVLVAHDWGGAIAWPLAAFHACLISKLIIMNAAHPSTFTREMTQNERQQKRSDYITDLISANGYDIITAKHFYRLKRLYGGWFEKLSARQQAQFETQWADRTSMQNAFAYYKCMPNLLTTRTKANTDVKLPNIRVEIPTLVLWGMKDTAFVPEVLHGLDTYVTDLRVIKFEDADHWLHHQQVENVIACINNFLDE